MTPILDQNSLEIISRSTEQTRRVGMRLGALLRPGDVICLTGDLGAGKTTLVQGLAVGWGSLDPVSSPTFMLVNVYRKVDKTLLYHLDAYRLNGPLDALDLDIDMMMDEGSLVVEWADRIEAALPVERLWVSLYWVDDTQRNLFFSAHGEHYQTLLSDFRGKVYGVS
jgi:tRNA threonylcarbamoyladenosine biosynthesis protein TsaE